MPWLDFISSSQILEKPNKKRLRFPSGNGPESWHLGEAKPHLGRLRERK